MGQRGARAAFMPNKYVFPGGAVDVSDSAVVLADKISEPCATRLMLGAPATSPDRIIAAAIRELWEETGLVLGRPGNWTGPIPENWRTYADTGHVPTSGGLHFVFRAITPPDRPRRFDARFLLADAAHIVGNQDDFSGASDELSHLQWIGMDRVHDLDLPFITEVVLGEVAAALPAIGPPVDVPFFNNNDEANLFERLGRKTIR